MDEIIVGSEALAAGLVTRHQLCTKYDKLHYNVYAQAGMQLDAADKARAAWLWSRRTATLVGTSAAAMHGAKWLPDDAPAELAHANQPAPPGIVIHRGTIAADEICLRQSIDCTTPARTASVAVCQVTTRSSASTRSSMQRDAASEIERIADRYPGARRMRRLRTVLGLAEETELRLLLVRDGLPRPVTQILVVKPGHKSRRIDMGWPQWKVGVEYDGEQHFSNPDDYADDIVRLEFLAAQGWIIVRVSSRQLQYARDEILRRVRSALELRH